MPDRPDFGGGVTHSVMHPAVLAAMLLSMLLILTLSRRKAIFPFLCVVFLAPYGQQIYAGGMHWVLPRIVILAGCARLLREKFTSGGKLLPGGVNGIDRAFIVWALYRGLAPILLLQAGGAVPGQAAMWLEAFGEYFLLRYLIQDVDDIVRVAKIFALLALVLGMGMANERLRNINVFGYAGSLEIIPIMRDGLVRARASFGHPIMAGCFGATLTPLFYWLWKGGKARTSAAIGMLGSAMMVFFSASSTPALAIVGGIGALALWPIRRSMRVVRWGLGLTVVGLHLVMKAPVWFLIARVNVTGSSDGYGRAMLVDGFIRHFIDWWLVGTNKAGTWGDSMWDLSNQFVAEGETGGLICFICFVAMISLGFSRLGKMRRMVKGDKPQEWLCWSLGAVMFAHILAYFGASYWDQTKIWWFAFLAMISAATTVALQNAPAKARSADTTGGAVLESRPDCWRQDPGLYSPEDCSAEPTPSRPLHDWRVQ